MVKAGPPAGVGPKGNLESYEWPTAAEVGKYVDWELVVHNNGDVAGVICAGITNKAGNPGAIVVMYGGTEFTVNPGYILRLYAENVPVCTRLAPVGTVKYMAAGEYTIRLGGGHRIDTTWVEDTYKDVG